MSKQLQSQAFKYLVLGGLAYLAYKKITGAAGEVLEAAGDFATSKLNPASDENIVYSGIKSAVGEDKLSSAGLSFFDQVDTAAEWLGFENGINGIKGTTAAITEQFTSDIKAAKSGQGAKSLEPMLEDRVGGIRKPWGSADE